MRHRSSRILAFAVGCATLLGPIAPGHVAAADGRDHAQGEGALHPAGTVEPQTFQFDASSDPDGSNTAGTFRWTVGPWVYEGTIECMTVSGNRAVIGGRVTSSPADLPDVVGQVTTMYIEDNGADGDRFYNTGIGGGYSVPGQLPQPDCRLYPGYAGYPLDSGSITIVDEAVPYQPAPTLAGFEGYVFPPDTTTGITTGPGSRPVAVAFDSVTTSGGTSLTTSSTGPAVPSGFSLADPPTYYDISTTAGFTGGATVCIVYDSGLVFNAEQLRMLHYENGAWVDITDSVDTDGTVVCGRTTSLSLFVIGVPSSSSPDADGDGIDDRIDTGNGTFTNGVTSGAITDTAGHVVLVSPDPEGVRITVSGTGSDKATFAVCGFTLRLAPGSEVVVSCGSITTHVLSGSAELVLGDGLTLVSMPAGVTAKLTDNPDGGYRLSDISGGLVTVTVDGVTTRVDAGESLSLEAWDFVGFAAPVDNGGVLNVVKAGQGVPLKWRVLDAAGIPVTDLSAAIIRVSSLSCSAGQGSDQLEETATGSAGLQNLGNGYYQLNWKTPKTYANSCKTMRLDIGDGVEHTALFKFTK